MKCFGILKLLSCIGIGRTRLHRKKMAMDRGSSHQPVVSRTASSKRKIEELDMGAAESAARSQVRARREPPDEAPDRSMAESSVRVPGEAQSLDAESCMREEAGKSAIDADTSWKGDQEWELLEAASKRLVREDGDLRGEEAGHAPELSSSVVTSRATLSADTAIPNRVSAAAFSGNSLCGAGGTLFREATEVASSVSTLSRPIGDGSLYTRGYGEVCSREQELEGKDLELTDAGEWSDGSSGEEDQLSGRHLVREQSNDESSEENSGILDCGSASLSPDVFTHAPSERPESDSDVLLDGSVNSMDCAICATGEGIASTVSAARQSILEMNEATSVDLTTPARLQIFVKTFLDSRTILLQAHAADLIDAVHQQILLRTGLPIADQRLIFGGRQLQHGHTLEMCGVTNDATLHLVARMRSTTLPHSWQLVNDLVDTLRNVRVLEQNGNRNLRMQLQDRVKGAVKEFLKMASKSLPIYEHMQIFQLAGATSALVMLLLSHHPSNKGCAEKCITLFLSSNDDYLPPHVHYHCAPILLDFCKLLGKSAPNHNLYNLCRAALARLLDTVGVVSPYFNEAKPETIVHDFSPFVQELALKVVSSLESTALAFPVKDSSISFGYVQHAKEFTAFVAPLCKAMKLCKGIEFVRTMGKREDAVVVGSAGYRPNMQHYRPNSLGVGEIKKPGDEELCKALLSSEVGSHQWLLVVFQVLLRKVGNCLKGIAQGVTAQEKSVTSGPTDVCPYGWAPFLFILKGLHAIAMLDQVAMDDLLYFLCSHQTAMNVLIYQSRWHDDNFWLLDYKFLLDVKSRKRLAMAMLPEPQDDHDERQEILVNRGELLAESFELLAYVEPEVLHGGISVEFAVEEATGPGVLREWFCTLCREIFNPGNALFVACPNDRRRFHPNPASGVNPGHLTYFRFCGRVLALALMHKVQVDVVLALSFFKQLSGLPVVWEDAKDADPCLYDSCKKILEMDPAVVDSDILGLTFISEKEELGCRETLELCEGGKDMVVTSRNRERFVELLVQRRLVASVADQVKSFSEGFQDVLVNATPCQFFQVLEPEDLDQMLYGNDRNICLSDWRTHTEYHGYSSSDLQIVWFWQVAEAMTAEQRRKLLFFSTSVSHLPAQGFAGLSSKFHIHRAHTDISWLPTAHTCFFQLILPPYPSYDMMSARLQSITEGHIAEGFGFA